MIHLVTDCSRSPRFEAKTPEDLAGELVKAQEAEREQIKALSEQFRRSFASIGSLSKAFQPEIARWVTDHQRTMAAISKSFTTPRLSAMAAISTPSAHEQMRSLGLTASVRKEMFPTLQATRAVGLAATPSLGLLSQRVRLPDTIASELSKSVNRSLSVYTTQTIPPSLATLARGQPATISEVVRAAGEAALLVEQDGDREQARELRAVSAEVVAVAEAPTVEKFEEMISNLSEHMTERFDDLKHQIETNEERRQSKRRDDLTLNVFLWFLAIYLALFIFILDQLPRN